jgi:hypothetical protein
MFYAYVLKVLAILLIFLAACNSLTAQHIGYKDRTKPASATVVKEPPTIVKVVAEDSVTEIITPHSECPGMSASLPVLTNYVSPDIVKTFKKKFEDHVYSITAIKVSANQFQYKLKVCYNGEFVIRFVDTDGDILR